MLGIPSVRVIRRKQFGKAAERGRKRAERLVHQLPDLREEILAGVVQDVRRQAEPVVDRALRQAEPLVEQAMRQAAPLVERATGRKRRARRRGAVGLALIALLAGFALAGYILWQRRDKEPARLVSEPDEPSRTPASSPSPASSGPSGPDAAREPSQAPERTHAAMHREPAAARPSAQGAPGVPAFPASASAPSASLRDRVPEGGHRPFSPR
jgi:hypothetical protein